MPCISGSYNPAVGPLVRVAILKLPAEIAAKPEAGQKQKFSTFQALIDTGAISTCISQKVVEEAGLTATGKTLITGVTGDMQVDQFTFGVGFILSPQQHPSGEVSGDISVQGVQGCLFENKTFPFDVLLGRDIICAGSFSLSFDGHYILSF